MNIVEFHHSGVSKSEFLLRVADGSVYLAGPAGPEDIGPLADVYELLDGETYTIEYDSPSATAAWVDTDDEGTYTFEVREAIESMPLPRGYAESVLAESPEPGDNGMSPRTQQFVEVLCRIWDAKGNAEELSEFHVG